MSPFKLAFYSDIDSTAWSIFDIIIDVIFIIDVILIFFEAFYDTENNLIIKRKDIIINYVFGWFPLDFMSSLPVDWITDSDINIFFRLSKLPRLLKVFKMLKIMRLLKLVRSHKMLGGFFKHPQAERLFLSLILYFIVFHVVACLWMISGSYDTQDNENWLLRLDYLDQTVFQQYVACWYWTLQTVLTVGRSNKTHFGNNQWILGVIRLWGFACRDCG